MGGCSGGIPPLLSLGDRQVDSSCSTPAARISFDFEAASFSRCAIDGEREFTILVTPEHGAPINPSPWYAFRYKADPGADLTIHLRYLGGEHRYAPHWSEGGEAKDLPVEVNEDRTVATMTVPTGKGTVSAQEIINLAHYRKLLKRWSKGPQAKRIVLGTSHDGRKIAAVHLGNADAPRLVLLFGRQHPPEVTGAIAMEAFVDRIVEMVAADPSLGERYQFLIVPALNPDGVARGNWRANLGGKDLNRDWGSFSQPETQAVKRWLDALPMSVRPVLMLDFHSTWRNLFYVQGEDIPAPQERFLQAWLGGKEANLPGYPFTIERRDANPGGGTTKGWFHETYAIPAYTYEVADDADRVATREAARILAEELPDALKLLSE